MKMGKFDQLGAEIAFQPDPKALVPFHGRKEHSVSWHRKHSSDKHKCI